MVEQVSNCQRSSRLGNSRQIDLQRTIEIDETLLMQRQNRGRGKLLGNRSDWSDRLGRERQAPLAIGQAVARVKHDLPVRFYQDCTAELRLPLDDVIDAMGQIAAHHGHVTNDRVNGSRRGRIERYDERRFRSCRQQREGGGRRSKPHDR